MCVAKMDCGLLCCPDFKFEPSAMGGSVPKVEYDPIKNSWSLEPSESDWHQLARVFGLGRRDVYIDYSPDRAAEAYQDSDIRFVQTSDGRVTTPIR